MKTKTAESLPTPCPVKIAPDGKKDSTVTRKGTSLGPGKTRG